MTTARTTPPRSWFTRWVTALLRAFWHAQAELAEVTSWSNPFPQADLQEAKRGRRLLPARR